MRIYVCDSVKREVMETIEGDAEKAMEVAEGYCEKGEKVVKSGFKTESGRGRVRIETPVDYSVFYFLEGGRA